MKRSMMVALGLVSLAIPVLLAACGGESESNAPAEAQPPQQAQADAARIAELKANPRLTVDNIYDLQRVISFSEWKELFETARRRVVEGSVEGMEFDLVFIWKKGNWVYFNVVPENIETDISQLFLEKVDDHWEAYGPGTALPGLYEQHPELFE